MSVDNMVPEIRFKGFSGEWENLTLGDLGSVAMNKRIFKHQTTIAGDVPFFKIGTFGKQPDAFISKSLFDEYKAKYPYPVVGDLLLSASGSIGRVVEYKGEEQYFQDSNIVWLKHDGNIDNAFLKVFYSMVKWSGLEGSTIKRLYNRNILDTEISTPKRQEQIAIGYYFQKLDTLINQHQQKHDKLSNIKKAMLEKMFPKQGETLPEIRFKGFSGEWVERSWSDTVDISTNMVDPRNCQYSELFHVGPGNIESFTGRFYNNVLKVKDSNLISGKFHFNNGDIIYGKINPQLAKYVIAPFEGLASADAYVLNTKNGVVQNYLFAILHTEDFYKYSVSVSSRTGMPKINRDELNIYSYMAPSESEQTQIGNYFQKLDALLNQHQQQITKLNNIKQACLSKMFV
ncbi:restriction endonuclease subunit S [Rahnella sp. GSA61A]|uniref:restriction endonuclease subunit S n=1 Tax=Rahnella sp. GSA61A TaxID=2862678 RepID=UPI001CBE7FD6|nr:restriction endonuclease subunit S [Rahnella sp. GSA61A]